MFNETKKGSTTQDSISAQNIIAQGTKFVGDFTSKSDLRIDGKIEGNVKTPGKVVVGKTGSIVGTLESTNAHFEGHFKGNLKLSGTLTLKSTAVIEGEVVTEKLAVEPGAAFNVKCEMKSANASSNSSNHITKAFDSEKKVVK